jgi:hypothetical protein
MRILSILCLQVMYHQGRTKDNSFMKVVSTYRIHSTSSEYVLMNCSEGVCWQRKAFKLFRSATHHHIEDIMGYSVLMRRFGRVYSFGQPCMKTLEISSGAVERVRGMGISIQEMPCHSPTTFRLSSLMSGNQLHGTISKVKELRVHLSSS